MPTTFPSRSTSVVQAGEAQAVHMSHHVCIYRAYSEDRGHYVHVSINRNRKMFQKCFSEKLCGGAENAMRLSQAWRDTIVAKHPPMSLMSFCSILRSNNTTGVVGIHRTTKRHRSKSGRVSENSYWQARIPNADGTNSARYFSIKIFGEDGAKSLAIDARMQGISALKDVAFREKHQPQPVSNLSDIALLEEATRSSAERRARKIAERAAKRAQSTRRAAEKLALASAAQEEALDRVAKSGAELYIGRCATPNSTSSYWRVGFRRQGTHHRKCFSDSVYGGEAAALLAARGWRDGLLCTLSINSKAAVVVRVKANNTSAVAGVTRRRVVRAGETLHQWVAYAPQTIGMPRRSRTFSIAKYGEEDAFAQAVKARAEFVAELGEVEFLHHPAARQMKRLLQAK